ncbi:ankyrin [Neocallimastix lanati (nom. inval.)]|nr:ankyrin [Neocallimastix sp. JGI-2020a]
MVQNGFYTNIFGYKISFIDTPLIFFTKLGKIDLIQNLLKNGSSPNEVDAYGLTPIFYAIDHQNVRIVKLLHNREADIKGEVIYINNPLMFFIGKKMNGIVKVLLENKASLEEVDDNGNTPLFQAIKKKNYEIFDLLIHQYPIDITKRNKNDKTPLMYAIFHGEKKFDPFAIELKRIEKIEKIDDQGNMLLLKLVKNSNSDIRMIENLLSSGANVNYCDDDNKTPLIYAVENEDIELVKLLIKYKADINYEVCGRTPLKLAIKKNNIDIARIILEEKERKKK